MKKNRIMWFIILIILVVGSTIIYIKKELPTKDEKKFKEEYEKVNNTKTSSGQDIRVLNIPKKNSIRYLTMEEVVEKIEKKESFIVYFGFNTCPWCRSVIETLIDTVKNNSNKKIYYVDVKETRDIYKLDENNKPMKVQEGAKGYNKLIKEFSSVLSDYTLTTSTNEKINVGEKRIYAPNVIGIVDGKAKIMVTGISDELTNPYMKLTDDIKKYAIKEFKKLLKVFD